MKFCIFNIKLKVKILYLFIMGSVNRDHKGSVKKLFCVSILLVLYDVELIKLIFQPTHQFIQIFY